MDFVDDLDSNCYAQPIDAEGPTDATCGDDAVTYVELPGGTRRYLCEAHADVVDRYGDVESGVRARECERCRRETPVDEFNSPGADWVCPDCQ